MGAYGGPDIITDGLVFLVDAASERSYPGSGNTWYDLSGNNYDLTLTNGPVWNSAGYFDNDVDSYFTGSGGSNIPTGNDSYTMVVWARQPNTWGLSDGFIAIGGFGTTNGSNALRTLANSTGQFHHYWWGNDLSLTSNAGGIVAGEWFQVAASFDGTTRRIWVNGVSRASDTPGSSHNVTSTDIYVSRAYTSEYQDNGDMAIACIYDRALTSAEMLQNFNAQKNRFI